MSIVRSRVRVISMALALFAGLAAPAATLAADGARAGQPEPARHCVALPDQPSRCFATFAAGLIYATGGRVTTNDPSTAIRDVSAARLLDGLEIRAVLFTNSGYGGSTFTIYDYDVCTWEGDQMISGWNDVVSSVQVGSTCGISLFENTFQSGAQLNVTSNTSYVGDAMNDRTSSWRLF